jgi:hypothetical protein
MQSETLASSVWVWSSHLLVRSLQTLGCNQRLHSIQTQRLALWVVHWLVVNYLVQWVQSLAVFWVHLPVKE